MAGKTGKKTAKTAGAETTEDAVPPGRTPAMKKGTKKKKVAVVQIGSAIMDTVQTATSPSYYWGSKQKTADAGEGDRNAYDHAMLAALVGSEEVVGRQAARSAFEPWFSKDKDKPAVLTIVHQATLEHIRKQYTFSQKADEWLIKQIKNSTKMEKTSPTPGGPPGACTPKAARQSELAYPQSPPCPSLPLARTPAKKTTRTRKNAAAASPSTPAGTPAGTPGGPGGEDSPAAKKAPPKTPKTPKAPKAAAAAPREYMTIGDKEMDKELLEVVKAAALKTKHGKLVKGACGKILTQTNLAKEANPAAARATAAHYLCAFPWTPQARSAMRALLQQAGGLEGLFTEATPSAASAVAPSPVEAVKVRTPKAKKATKKATRTPTKATQEASPVVQAAPEAFAAAPEEGPVAAAATPTPAKGRKRKQPDPAWQAHVDSLLERFLHTERAALAKRAKQYRAALMKMKQ